MLGLVIRLPEYVILNTLTLVLPTLSTLKWIPDLSNPRAMEDSASKSEIKNKRNVYTYKLTIMALQISLRLTIIHDNF